jgi:RNA polymerase sigma factor (sigma-70 family)
MAYNHNRLEEAYKAYKKNPQDEATLNGLMEEILKYYIDIAKVFNKKEWVNLETEEILQESMKKIAERLLRPNAKEIVNFPGYIFIVFKNVYISQWNKEKRLRSDTLNTDPAEEIDDHPYRHIDVTTHQETLKKADKRIDQHFPPLTKREREVMKLMIRGNSYDQIAKELGISTRRVQNIYYQANQKLTPEE